MPFLFQRQLGTTRRCHLARHRPGHAARTLRRSLAGQHPEFRAASFTPHDFRRILPPIW